MTTTKTENESLLDFAKKIENSIEKMDVNALEECLNKCDYMFENINELEQIQLYYYKANIYTTINNIKNKQKNLDWIRYRADELLNIRRALLHPKFNEAPLNLRCQIKTNFGNCLYSCARYVEAIEEYDAVIRMRPDFAMALGRRAICLRKYSELLYDKNHQKIIYFEAYKSLEKALHSTAYWDTGYDENATSFFEREKTILKNKLDGYIEQDYRNSWPNKLSKKEIEYRTACLWYKLFLNPLNDISNILPIAARDIFHLPYHTYCIMNNILLIPTDGNIEKEKIYIDWTKTDLIYNIHRLDGAKENGSIKLQNLPKGFPFKKNLEAAKPFLKDIILAISKIGHAKVTAPWFVEFFNALKQEFITARFMYTDSLKKENRHFADKETYLPSIGEYIVYGIAYEKLKISFRVAYSLFDKISGFLHTYLDIKAERKIYSKSFWGNLTLEKKELYAGNWPLRALIHLIHDFLDNDIRHAIEHRFLFIYDVEKIKKLDQSIACKITIQDLQESTLKILKLARSALIYLSLAVKIEEHRRDSEK